MPLQVPNLDDRTYDQLLEAALARLRASSQTGQWTDLSPSDPGRTLLELYAYLTETLLYRVNRIPVKLYVEFLRLMGVTMLPPAAAGVWLTFSREDEGDQPVTIPAGTRVSTGTQDDAPVFRTIETVTLAAGATSVNVMAYHYEQVEETTVITYDGQQRLHYTVQRGPILAAIPGVHTLEIGIEVPPDQVDKNYAYLYHDDTPFRRWTEVENFANLTPETWLAYTSDRAAGQIWFAPMIAPDLTGERPVQAPEPTEGETAPSAVQTPPQQLGLAALPEPERRMLVRYWRGGGKVGNVPAGTLTALVSEGLDSIGVTNRQAATGGRDVETLDQALVRGSQAVHHRDPAVPASDYERLVTEAVPGVVRAYAYTQAERWSYGQPGAVEVLLVPELPHELRRNHQVDIAALREHQTDATLQRARELLHSRRPLGVPLYVDWARYKVVNVSAQVVTYRDAGSNEEVMRALEKRVRQALTPLPGLADVNTPEGAYRAGAERFRFGWPFGSSLFNSYVYDLMLSVPGVRYVENVQLSLDDVPDADVSALAADHHQAEGWYAAAHDLDVYRSLNDGQGWELMQRFAPPAEMTRPVITAIVADPQQVGRLAVIINDRDSARAEIWLSRDCGHTWAVSKRLQVKVHEAAWLMQPGSNALLLAADSGLLRLDASDGSIQAMNVDRRRAEQGYYGVVSFRLDDGTIGVAVAAQEQRGVFLSVEAGRSYSFRDLGLQGFDVRHLEVQLPRLPSGDAPPLLWAATSARPGETGDGCFYQALRGTQDDPQRWQTPLDWVGGSCTGLAFDNQTVYAASYGAGVLRAEIGGEVVRWVPATVESRLPLAAVGRFVRIEALGLRREGARRTLLAAGERGVYRASRDNAGALSQFTLCSARITEDCLTLPPTYLFVAGEVKLDVRGEHEAH